MEDAEFEVGTRFRDESGNGEEDGVSLADRSGGIVEIDLEGIVLQKIYFTFKRAFCVRIRVHLKFKSSAVVCLE